VKDITKEKVDFTLIEKEQKLMQIVLSQNLSIINEQNREYEAALCNHGDILKHCP